MEFRKKSNKQLVFIFILAMTLIIPAKNWAILEENLIDEQSHQVKISSQLETEEADEIINYLKEQGISSQKQLVEPLEAHHSSHKHWKITVLSNDAVEAILLINEAGLPKRKKTSIFEEYVSRLRQGYTMTEKHKAISRHLEEEIKKKSGIVNAEVLIKKEKPPLGNEEVLKAMLYVQHTGSLDDPHSEFAENIKKEILDNVDELDEENLIFISEKKKPKTHKLPEY